MSLLLSSPFDAEQPKRREVFEKAKEKAQPLFNLTKQAMEVVHAPQVSGQINGIIHIIDGAIVYTLWLEEEKFDSNNSDHFGTDGMCAYYGELRVAVSSSSSILLLPKDMFHVRKKLIAPWSREEDNEPLKEEFCLLLSNETHSDILQLTSVSDQISRLNVLLEHGLAENKGYLRKI